MAPSSATKKKLTDLPPEVLGAVVGSHVPHSDLAACALISKTGYYIFNPVLWSTIDDQFLYGPQPGPGTNDRYSTDLINSRKDLIHKYGDLIHHLTVFHVPALITLASDPKVSHLRSLTFSNKEPWTPQSSDQLQAVGSPNIQAFPETLSLIADRPGPGNHSQDRSHIARIVFSLALRNRGALTTLSLGDTDVLPYFASTQAFYTMLAKLPNLQKLRIPGRGISIVPLNQALPRLQVLHLARRDQTVAGLHAPRGQGRWLRNLFDESEEWCHVATAEEQGQASAVAATPLSIKKLNLEDFVTFRFFRQLLAQFPTMREMCLPVFKTLDLEADRAFRMALKQAAPLQVEWTIGPDLTETVVLNACCGHDLDTPFVQHNFRCQEHELTLLQNMSPLLRIRRG